jgi:hypothetical protein
MKNDNEILMEKKEHVFRFILYTIPGKVFNYKSICFVNEIRERIKKNVTEREYFGSTRRILAGYYTR